MTDTRDATTLPPVAAAAREPYKQRPASEAEEKLFAEFIRTHYTGLFTLLRRQIRNSTVAAEILDEAVATTLVHLRSGRVSDPQRLGGYLYRVAMNLYRNHRRGFDNRADLRAAPADLYSIAAQPELDGVVDSRMLQEVRAIIASLPTARDRELVKRFYLDEEDKDVICKALAITPIMFDRVIFRARQRMRALLEARGIAKGDIFSICLCLM